MLRCAHLCMRTGCRCLRRMRPWWGVHERGGCACVRQLGRPACGTSRGDSHARRVPSHPDFPNLARELKNIVIKGGAATPPSLHTPRGCNPRGQVVAVLHSNPARRVAPLRPPAPVLACMGRQLLLRWNLRESLVATACLAGHGGVPLRSASRLPTCTYASGACRLCCRSPGVPRGINILRRSGHGEGCPLTPGRSLERT